MRKHTIRDVSIYPSIQLAHTEDTLYDHSIYGDLSCMGMCISLGVSVDALNRALQRATLTGLVRVVSLLLSAGADVHTDNDACIMHAFRAGRVDIMSVLFAAGADIDRNDDRLLELACERGEYDAVMALLGVGVHIPPYALLAAVKNGHPHIVQALVSAGCDVHPSNELALRLAVFYNQPAIHILLAAGANVHVAIKACHNPVTRNKLRGLLRL